MKHALSLVLGLLSSLVGCASSDGQSAKQASPIETCSASYHCTHPDDEFDTRLERSPEGACVMGKVELRPDGTTSSGTTQWSAEGTTLKICAGDDCLTCVDLAAPKPPAAESGGKCSGSPDSCSSQSPGSCSDIRGCRMRTTVKYNGTYDNECDGSPDDCDDMTSETSCIRQGCNWR